MSNCFNCRNNGCEYCRPQAKEPKPAASEPLLHKQIIENIENLKANHIATINERDELRAEIKETNALFVKHSQEYQKENASLKAEVEAFEECCDVMWPEWREAPLGINIARIRKQREGK